MMVDLPHRFVPTLSKFVSPVRIVSQSGHDYPITAVSFSPCHRFFASADSDGHLKLWVVETLDILGSYLLDFVCTRIEWEGLDAVVCHGNDAERRIEFMPDDDPIESPQLPQIDPSRVIRLIGAPEVKTCKNHFTVKYSEQNYKHELRGLKKAELEPCERYVVAVSPDELVVCSAFDETELIRKNSDDGIGQWLDFCISSRGDAFHVLTQNGSVWIGDPVKSSFSCAYKGSDEVTAYDFGGDTLVLYGNSLGNLTLYHVPRRSILLRTPRSPKGFMAVWPSPEKIGFLALRQESATAFFGYSEEILSAAPLPAAYSASCPGSCFSEVFVACQDHQIYRLKLDDNSIVRCCTLAKDELPVQMAANGQFIAIYTNSGHFRFFNGSKEIELPEFQARPPKAMAITDNGKTLAILDDEAVHIIDISGKTVPQTVECQGGVQILFDRDKTVNKLFIFSRDGDILCLDSHSMSLEPMAHLCLEHARVLTVAQAAKSYVFVLAQTEHGQMAILKVGLNTGKSSVSLRVFTLGTQIWAASSNEQTVNLRSDASCLRIIAGLKAYSIDDWIRSEPLSLY